MNKRYLIVVGSLVTFLCLVVGVLAMLPARRGVYLANYERITDGMTRSEIEELFGPPTDLSPGGICWGDLHNGMLTIGHERVVWGGDDGAAVIVFNEQGRALHKNWTDNPRTILEKLRRLLRLN